MKEKKDKKKTRNLRSIRSFLANRLGVGKQRIVFTPEINLINDKRVLSLQNIPVQSYLVKPLTKEIKGKLPRMKRVLTASQKKKNWMNKIRNQRIVLKANRKQIGNNYRKLYKEIKGNVFKNSRVLLDKINEKKTN